VGLLGAGSLFSWDALFADVVFEIQNIGKHFYSALLSTFLVLLPSSGVQAGGGMVIEGDVCVIWIDFYSAHFTAYQPVNHGNKQFCQELPDTGPTIFVLDYLHKSLKDVPVSFRIIHDVTGQGDYVKLKHVEKINDIERHTVFYQPPLIRADASLKIEHDFALEGRYIGIITAGHPTNDMVYTAIFPFEIGGSSYGFLLPVVLLLVVIATYLLRRVSLARKVAIHNRASS
jgi:hypothetical protein